MLGYYKMTSIFGLTISSYHWMFLNAEYWPWESKSWLYLHFRWQWFIRHICNEGCWNNHRQRAYVSWPYCYQYLEYEDGLTSLILPSLLYRRFHGNMFQVYNIINLRVHLDPSLFFTFSHLHTRGYNYKLFKPISNRDVHQNVFSYRIINNWNSLPDVTVNVSTLNQFKHLIDSNNTHTMHLM